MYIFAVAPFAGAWIEISAACLIPSSILVAPFAGAWIEIYIIKESLAYVLSHPSRVRGLKYLIGIDAPNMIGRTLRGCVD